MNFTTQISQVIIGLLFSALFLSCSNGETGNNPIEKNEKGEILAPEERTWNNNLIGQEISLHSDISDSLFNGLVIEGYRDQLYVSDFGDMRLKRFDLEGNYLDSFGSKGKGPGDFRIIMDFDISNSDTLFLIDARKMRLMTFNIRTADFIKEYETEPNLYRLAVVNNQLIIERGMAEKLFYLSDFQGNETYRFGEVMENKRQNGMSVSGDIHAAENDTGFVFSPRYASYLYFFDNEGNRTKTISTPDRIPYSEPVQESQGDMQISRPPETELETSDLKISGRYICELLQNNNKDNELPGFVDVYDLETGGYLHSLELPSPAGDILVTDERLYLINSELAQLQAYEFSQKN